MKKLAWIISSLFCIAILGINSVQAARLTTGQFSGLNLRISKSGTSFNLPVGNISNSVLDGQSLEFMYSIDLIRSINKQTTYETTTSYQDQLKIRADITPEIAGKIAWLITTQAETAISKNQQAGLQMAIWKQIYASRFVLGDSLTGELRNYYNNYLNAVNGQSASVNSVLWLDPQDNNQHYQQQVAWSHHLNLTTPIPAAIWLFISAISGIFGLISRRKS